MSLWPPLNYGRTFGAYQFIWWGWRYAFTHRPMFAFYRATPPLDGFYRWFLHLCPLEIRRWSDR